MESNVNLITKQRYTINLLAIGDRFYFCDDRGKVKKIYTVVDCGDDRGYTPDGSSAMEVTPFSHYSRDMVVYLRSAAPTT